MTNIFCILGKSSSGKDTVFSRLLADEDLGLKQIVTYTTRPIRAGESEGVEYHFVTAAEEAALEGAGKVIEKRTYNTVFGPWDYFTADNGQIVADGNYIVIATIDSFTAFRAFYRKAAVLPIYIYVEDGLRLSRAIERERREENPRYEEVCRRFLADAADFSDERLEEAGVTEVFENENIDEVTERISTYIKGIEYGYKQSQ